jgi:hypothetical protein
MKRDAMRSAYFRTRDMRQGEEVTGLKSQVSGLKSDLVFLDGSYLYTALKEGAVTLWNLVPPCIFGPPEKVWIDKVESDLPGVIMYSYGKGRTAYFPWNVGRLYYGHSSPGHEQAVLSVLLDLRNGERQIVTNAHPLVEVTLSTNSAGDYVLSLVNSSGHQSTAFFEPVPMHDIEVKMKLPQDVSSM